MYGLVVYAGHDTKLVQNSGTCDYYCCTSLHMIYMYMYGIVLVVVLCVVGPLAQSAERRADNAKVVSSSLTWTTFFSVFFLSGRCCLLTCTCSCLLYTMYMYM